MPSRDIFSPGLLHPQLGNYSRSIDRFFYNENVTVSNGQRVSVVPVRHDCRARLFFDRIR